MKKNIILLFSSLFLISALFSLTGCPLETREDIQKRQDDRQLRDQVATIQRTRADEDVKYSDVQGELRSLSGKIETIDHNQQVGSQNSRQEVESLKKLVEAQNEKIRLLEQHIEATETRLTAAIQASAPAPAAPSGVTSNGVKKKEGPLDDADALLANKEFKRAIVKYQAYIDHFPKGSKLAEANYKIGACFAEIGMKREAREFLKDLVTNYPESAWAKKAKFRLQHLK